MRSPCGRAQTTRANTQNGTISGIQSLNLPKLFASRSVEAVRDKEMLMRKNLEFGDLILVEALCRLTLPTLSEAFFVTSPVLKTLCMPSNLGLTRMNMQVHLSGNRQLQSP